MNSVNNPNSKCSICSSENLKRDILHKGSATEQVLQGIVGCSYTEEFRNPKICIDCKDFVKKFVDFKEKVQAANPQRVAERSDDKLEQFRFRARSVSSEPGYLEVDEKNTIIATPQSERGFQTESDDSSMDDMPLSERIKMKPRKIGKIIHTTEKPTSVLELKKKEDGGWEIKKHTREIRFCLGCGKKFQNLTFLYAHKKSGKCTKAITMLKFSPKCEDGKWICCGVAYDSRERYADHKKHLHPGKSDKRLKPYCTICRREFYNILHYYAHKKTPCEAGRTFTPTRVDGVWNCCGRTFKTGSSSWWNHRKKEHPDAIKPRPCFCSKCKAKFDSMNALLAHKEYDNCQAADRSPLEFNPVKVDGGWECCGVVYKDRKQLLRNHKYLCHQIKRKDPNLPAFCKTCRKKFKNLTSLHEHLKNETCSPPSKTPKFNAKKVPGGWKCCGTLFKRNTFTNHKRTIHPEAIMERESFCKTCGERFPNLLTFHAHKKSGECNPEQKVSLTYNPKTVDGKWFCCGTMFNTNLAFSHHKRFLHPDQMKDAVVFCRICCKKFESNMLFHAHKRTGNCKPPTNLVFNPIKVGEMWECCGHTFKTKTVFYHHKHRIHNI